MTKLLLFDWLIKASVASAISVGLGTLNCFCGVNGKKQFTSSFLLDDRFLS